MWIDDEGARHPTVIPNLAVYGFFEQYRYLSNYHSCLIELDGRVYNSSEAAYMALKCYDEIDMNLFVGDVSPSQAKKWGTKVTLRPDWEHYRLIAMMQVLTAKFTQNQYLYDLLVHTGDMYLEETNNWNDTFWGVDINLSQGYNMLGKSLMAVREVIR